MSDLVDPNKIERIVGAPRHPYQHIARMIDGTVYILHSQRCKDSGIDLRECEWSRSLDAGVVSDWDDRPYFVAPLRAGLLPIRNSAGTNYMLDDWIAGGAR